MSTADAPKDANIRSASLGSKNRADKKAVIPIPSPAPTAAQNTSPTLSLPTPILNALFSTPLIFEKYSLRRKAALLPNDPQITLGAYPPHVVLVRTVPVPLGTGVVHLARVGLIKPPSVCTGNFSMRDSHIGRGSIYLSPLYKSLRPNIHNRGCLFLKANTAAASPGLRTATRLRRWLVFPGSELIQ